MGRIILIPPAVKGPRIFRNRHGTHRSPTSGAAGRVKGGKILPGGFKMLRCLMTNRQISASGEKRRIRRKKRIPAAHIRITYDRRAYYSVENKACRTPGEVYATLRAIATLRSDFPVIIDPDGNVPMDDVINVYDLCRSTGLEKIQFAAEKRE